MTNPQDGKGQLDDGSAKPLSDQSAYVRTAIKHPRAVPSQPIGGGTSHHFRPATYTGAAYCDEANMLEMCVRYLFGVIPSEKDRKAVFAHFHEQIVEMLGRPGLKDPDWSGMANGSPPGSHLGALLALLADYVLKRQEDDQAREELLKNVANVINEVGNRSPGMPENISLPRVSHLLQKPLSSLHIAAIDTLTKAFQNGQFTDGECLRMMQSWVSDK